MNAPHLDRSNSNEGHQSFSSPQVRVFGLFADGGKVDCRLQFLPLPVDAAGGIAGKYKVDVVFKVTYYDDGEAPEAHAEIKRKPRRDRPDLRHAANQALRTTSRARCS